MNRPSADAMRFVAGQLLMQAVDDRRMARDHADMVTKRLGSAAKHHLRQWELYERQAAHREAVARWLQAHIGEPDRD